MFLKNVWYVAGPAKDFTYDGVISRRICNEAIAFYRTLNDAIVALADQCPLGLVPLSMGVRHEDGLRCACHGHHFGADGACTDASLETSVKSYAIVERHGYAWLWLGEPAAADINRIPDFSFITSPGFTCVSGYLKIHAHHEMISDNLLDLSHVNVLHPQIASASHWTEWDNKVVVEGNTVWSMLWRPGQVPGAFHRLMWSSNADRGDGKGHVRWDAPSLLYADTAIANVGADIDATGLKTPSAHLLTPETEKSTHYFWESGRNARFDDLAFDEMLRSAVADIFLTQDGPMIEAQQQAMGDETDFLTMKPLILKADAAGLRARRMMRRLIREEQGGASSETAMAEAAE